MACACACGWMVVGGACLVRHKLGDLFLSGVLPLLIFLLSKGLFLAAHKIWPSKKFPCAPLSVPLCKILGGKELLSLWHR